MQACPSNLNIKGIPTNFETVHVLTLCREPCILSDTSTVRLVVLVVHVGNRYSYLVIFFPAPGLSNFF